MPRICPEYAPNQKSFIYSPIILLGAYGASNLKKNSVLKFLKKDFSENMRN